MAAVVRADVPTFFPLDTGGSHDTLRDYKLDTLSRPATRKELEAVSP
jgi:hypothetical protein